MVVTGTTVAELVVFEFGIFVIGDSVELPARSQFANEKLI